MPDDTTSTRPLRRGREVDPYAVLEVSPSASPEVINAAYRALARRLHPDLNGQENATRLMGELNTAYRLLSDPAWRAAYDARARSRAADRQRLQRPQPRERLLPPRRLSPADGDRARAVDGRRPRRDVGRGVLTATVTLVAVVVLVLGVAWWAMTDALDDSASGTRDLVSDSADRGLMSQLFSTSDRPTLDVQAPGGGGSSALKALDGTRGRSTVSQP